MMGVNKSNATLALFKCGWSHKARINAAETIMFSSKSLKFCSLLNFTIWRHFIRVQKCHDIKLYNKLLKWSH